MKRDWAHEMLVNAVYVAVLESSPEEREQMGLLLANRKATAPGGESFVYFVEASATGLIKIGSSRSPKRRLQQLQTAVASPLRILATESGGALRERELHSRFHFACIRGEWFRPDPRLVHYIAQLRLAVPS